MNWKQIDENTQWKHKQDLRAAANKAGFAYISEAIVTMYQQGKSSDEIGPILGVNGEAIIYRLHQFGVTLRPRGGLSHKSVVKDNLDALIEIGKEWNGSKEDLFRHVKKAFGVKRDAAAFFYAGKTWGGVGKIKKVVRYE